MTGHITIATRSHLSFRGTRPPQHHRKRGHTSAFARLLRRIQTGMTTDADMWRVLSLRSRLIRAEAERDAMREGVEELRARLEIERDVAYVLAEQCDFWREQTQKRDLEVVHLGAKLLSWETWEHDWVFGGDAPWPGHTGVTDPRETLDEMIRVAFGYPCDTVAEMQQEIGWLRAKLRQRETPVEYEDMPWAPGYVDGCMDG